MDVNSQLFDDNQNKFIEVLTRMKNLLGYEHAGQMKVVENLINLLTTNDDGTFTRMINGIDMWGGSGAVWEVWFEDQAKNSEFKNNIVSLIDVMEAARILGSNISPIRTAFQKAG